MSTYLTKAFKQVMKASRGSLSSYVPNAPHEYGQPLPEVAASDVQGLITPYRMREIVQKTPTAAACLNAILDYSSSVPILIRNRDASKRVDPTRKSRIQDYLDRPNPRDTGLQLRYQTYRDLSTMGFAAWEIEPDGNGKTANVWALDSARLKVDYDQHGTILGYNMFDSLGMPIHGADGVHGWEPEEVIFYRRDPISQSIYPTSRINQLFTCAVLEDLMLYFISGRFTDSNAPFGVYDMGDITEEELRIAIKNWNDQVSSGHRVLLTGSKGSHWFPFGYHLKDLEATALLSEIRGKIMSIMGVTMNELGESQDVNKSNGYNLSYTFKKRAIEPLLNEFCTTLTKRLLWDELGFTDLELYYEEIDSRDELLQAQIDEQYLKNGVWSFNEVMNRKGLPSVKGGDKKMVFTGSAWLPIEMLEPFAQAQLQAVEAAIQAEQMGAQNGPISPPRLRGPQSQETFTTPDGKGSSTTKIDYGKKQAPRGGKQALQQSGYRKDEH